MPSQPKRGAAGTPLQAQDKLTFLLALVPYLIDHNDVSVAEVAEHFGVPSDQIRDAIKLIAVSGVPGETRTYQFEDLFDISWDELLDHDRIVVTNFVAIDDTPRFSAREAAALIAGLQYLSSLPENADRAALTSLMSKLSRGASAQPSQVAVEEDAPSETLALIRASVEDGRQLEFDYLDSKGTSERRRVDPLLVESVDADWYLRGWCHLREAVRTFRLDRISNPVITDEPISHRAGDVRLPETLFEGSPDDLVVTIDIATAAEQLIADYIPDGAVRELRDDRVRTTVRVSHYHGLKRLIASMPGAATVVAPPEARDVVAGWASSAAARYAELPS
jgi:proteasome accessory factor C